MSLPESTLNSYQSNIQKYVDGTPSVVDGDMQIWLDEFVALLSGSHIFEFGSATGRDASYLQAAGLNVFTSDAVEGFVDILREQGFPAFHFNALTDEIPGDSWNGVLANAVLLHFTADETRKVIQKVYSALNDNGVFAFSVKKGAGEVWSNEKLDAPRYFNYWDEADLVYVTLLAGFKELSIKVTENWIFVTAVK